MRGSTARPRTRTRPEPGPRPEGMYRGHAARWMRPANSGPMERPGKATTERKRPRKRRSVVGSAQWQGAVFVDGKFRKPAGGGTIGVRDKASGEIFATAGLASEADVDAGRRGGQGGPAGLGGADLRRARHLAARRGGRPRRPGQGNPRAHHARDRLHRRQGRLRDLRRGQRADRGGRAGLPRHRRGAPDRPRRAVLAVRADPRRPGRRDHAVELPAGPGHAGDRARDRARQRGADQAVPGDARCPAGWRSPSCSRRPGCRPASSACCPATSRSASGWSPTRTSR